MDLPSYHKMNTSKIHILCTSILSPRVSIIPGHAVVKGPQSNSMREERTQSSQEIHTHTKGKESNRSRVILCDRPHMHARERPIPRSRQCDQATALTGKRPLFPSSLLLDTCKQWHLLTRFKPTWSPCLWHSRTAEARRKATELHGISSAGFHISPQAVWTQHTSYGHCI